MASRKCNDILTRLQEAKGQITLAIEKLNTAKLLVQQATTFQQLSNLEDNEIDSARIAANRPTKFLDVLLQEAKQNKCGPEIESQINSEILKARNVFNQVSTLNGERAAKQRQIQEQDRAERAAKASTTQNNQGTGVPGTAGQGKDATPDADQLEEIEVTAKKRPGSVTQPQPSDGLEEAQVTGKRNPTLISGDPAIPDQVEVDVQEPVLNLESGDTNQGLSGARDRARSQATLQDTVNFNLQEDWRVRLQLSPEANYLYKADDPGILLPLQQTNGVIFPYTPQINMSYAANYEPYELTHSNYKVYQYKNSSVDEITITCDFTAQDTKEANYLLAVIHFFRSVTKMFYGQDEQPKPGTPPPLCYIFGLGDFQFNAHPIAISRFVYSLPNNVDYIRASNTTTSPGVSKAAGAPRDNTDQASKSRLEQSPGTKIGAGGNPKNTEWNSARTPAGSVQPTYVPTKIQISLTAVPIVSRLDISKRFSLAGYSTGGLLRGVQNASGGIW